MSELNTSAFSMYKNKSKKCKAKKSKRERKHETDETSPKKFKQDIKEPINANRAINDSTINLKLQNGNMHEKKSMELKTNGHMNDLELENESILKKKSKKKLRKKKTKTLTSDVALFTSQIENCSDDDIPQLVQPILQSNKNKNPTEISTFINANIFEKNNIDTPIKLLKWILSPVEPSVFFEQNWEKTPLHISRNTPKYYRPVLSSAKIDTMLREHSLYFGRNVDVVKYVDDERITENPVGRAKASIVWDSYSKGYSIRILNPHTYNESVHMVLSMLQEYFGAMVGANVYLTPAGSQGFAPHYDDIEAFVIQLEGRKHWKLYNPLNPNENLARFSSKDFKRKDLGALIAEVTLNEGDILYMPRGCVHEAKTDDEKHSLHMTISTYQRTSYADLLEKLLPEALRRASAVNMEYRRGLPIGYLKQLGVANSGNNSAERTAILRTVQELMIKLANDAPIDFAADALGRKFMHEALPPVLDVEEKFASSKYDGERIKNGVLRNRCEIGPDTEIRLVRYYALRLAVENSGEARVYYCTENSKVYHGEEEQFITINPDMCLIIEILIQQYPNFVSVEFLPHDDLAQKIDLITELWDYGLLVTNRPLDVTDSDVSE